MDEKLYIPMGVKPEAEFFRGFGKKQMIQAAIGSLFGGVLACILWFITQNVTAVMITALTVIAGSVMMKRPKTKAICRWCGKQIFR